MKKLRLDKLLVDLGLADHLDQAKLLVMSGQVKVNGQLAVNPSTQYDPDATVELKSGQRYVSRGGEKLATALDSFSLTNLEDRICVDVGASTGGFTDCLLQHGAKKVYAVDVGYGELHWKLRNDSRVIIMERTNARFITEFIEIVSLITIDASFISLKILLPVVKNWVGESGGDVIVLVKPQFEAGRAEVSRGVGVIYDPVIHRRVLEGTLTYAKEVGFGVRGLIPSPLKGPKGNIEFLAHLQLPNKSDEELTLLINKVMDTVTALNKQDNSTGNSF